MSILDFHASLSKDHHTELASLSHLSTAQHLRDDGDDSVWTPWY